MDRIIFNKSLSQREGSNYTGLASTDYALWDAGFLGHILP